MYGMSYDGEYEGGGCCFLDIVLGLEKKWQERWDGSGKGGAPLLKAGG